MFKIILYIVFNLQAKTIGLQYKNLNSQIIFEDKIIVFKDKQTYLSLDKKACNEHLFNKSHAVMNTLLKESFPKSGDLNIFIDGQKFYENSTSKRGLFFIKFNDMIKILKYEEMLNCNKK